ncbi:MAG: iron-containing redox enzyme family protein [Methylococcus sp.]|nr:iron-containing redox enzyme family protein [Methylococcus sp.]
MNSLRGLCRTLLHDRADAAAVQAAEEYFESALAEALRKGSSPQFGQPWSPQVQPDPESGHRTVLLALAPTLLLDGIWLSRVAQPATAHHPAECRLLELYCRIVGLDDPAASVPLRFRARLVLAGVYLPPVADPGFFLAPGIPDFAWPQPAAQLCLLHRPRSYFPELLGYTLARSLREPDWWDDHDPAEAERCLALARSALEACPDRDEQRVHAGWTLYCALFAGLLGEAADQSSRRLTAREAMVRIVQAKRAHALGHHGGVMLAERSLDRWLAEACSDPGPLLDILRDSPFADRVCPAGSRLIRAMDFGGPMFGVFDAAERQICLDWIEDGDRNVSPSANGSAYVPSKAAPKPSQHPGPRSKRALYTALLQAESPADMPDRATQAVERILRIARIAMPFQRAYHRFFPYDEAAFHARIEAIHRHEIGRYRPLAAPLRIGKDYCHGVILQLAPAILVDGCWLAGIATAAESLDTLNRHLMKIYADELGNGRPERNHPNVYRRLLADLGIELPPFDSDAFAADPRFLDAAFDIPIYLLAIGQRTHSYFPELLGLNLAIELSGLGAGYMRAIDMLLHHGIDPSIVQLHLSIDNLASGHAARARDAIVIYMDEMGRKGGPEISRRIWKRIWTGYLSLNIAALALGFRFQPSQAGRLASQTERL